MPTRLRSLVVSPPFDALKQAAGLSGNWERPDPELGVESFDLRRMREVLREATPADGASATRLQSDCRAGGSERRNRLACEDGERIDVLDEVWPADCRANLFNFISIRRGEGRPEVKDNGSWPLPRAPGLIKSSGKDADTAGSPRLWGCPLFAQRGHNGFRCSQGVLRWSSLI
jgi:hypothetical protein